MASGFCFSSCRKHEDEFLSAWELFQSRLKRPSPLQVIHYIFDDSSDDLVSFLDLLDRVKTDFFQLSCVLPPASTWSRARHSELPGQLPLRSRSAPFGLDGLDPAALERVQRAHQQGAFCCWIAEQTLHCPVGKLVLVFPEDLGGDKNDGPSSIWSCRVCVNSPQLTNAVHWVSYQIYQPCSLHCSWGGHNLRHRARSSSVRVRLHAPVGVRLRTPSSKEPNPTTSFTQQKRIFWVRSSGWSA